jgi:hypothetical protein
MTDDTITEAETATAGSPPVFCANEDHDEPVTAVAALRWPGGHWKPTTACGACLDDIMTRTAFGDDYDRQPVLVDPVNTPTRRRPPRPQIVCLCGSTRFTEQFNQHRKALTEAGEIVLSIEVVTTQAREDDPQHANPDLKARLDLLHMRKIDLADYVLVVSDESGYFGESTTREIEHAVHHGKPLEFAFPAADERARAARLIR